MTRLIFLAQANGELSRPLALAVALAGFTAAAIAWFLVWRALPPDAWLAQLALPVLLLGASPGLNLVLTLVVKVVQGGRVQVASDR